MVLDGFDVFVGAGLKPALLEPFNSVETIFKMILPYEFSMA